MADFDNGLPPLDTDLTGKRISSITLDSSEYKAAESQRIQSVSIDLDEPKEAKPQSIKSITIDTEKVEGNVKSYSINNIVLATEPEGKNIVLFYL